MWKMTKEQRRAAYLRRTRIVKINGITLRIRGYLSLNEFYRFPKEDELQRLIEAAGDALKPGHRYKVSPVEDDGNYTVAPLIGWQIKSPTSKYYPIAWVRKS